MTVAPLGVERSVAGDAAVRPDELRKKLGATAYQVWQVLITHRSTDGVTHITRAGIGRAKGFVPLKDCVVAKALIRLRTAGLVRDMGTKYKKVPTGATLAVRKVFLRQVRGARTTGSAERFLLVPRETKSWMLSACGWGGWRHDMSKARAAASRPKDATPLEGIDPLQVYPQLGGSSVSTDLISSFPLKSPSHLIGSLPSEESSAGQSPRIVPPSGGGREQAVEDHDDSELGEVITSPTPAKRAVPISTPIDGVPPYPGISVVPAAIVPSPPLLDEEAGDLERAHKLADAYRSAYESRFKKKCWVFKTGALAKSKHYANLVAAAEGLVEHSIAPAAWAAFSFDLWKTHTPTKPPPVAWVFSAKRLEERRWMFRKEENDYGGGRLVFTDVHKELLVRYSSMRALIARGVNVREAVERFFPGDTYERMVSDAKQEAVEMQQRFREQVAKGAFLW